MGKTLAIIELYQHDEVLRHYCDLLSDSGYNIKVFCSKVVYECLGEYTEGERFEWHVNNEEKSISDFLNEKEVIIKDSDLVFVTTALSDFRAFYNLSKKNKTLLLVHNAHSFLAPERYMFFREQVFDRLRWVKLYFQGAHFYKKKMLGSLNGLAFPTDKILNYVKETFDLPAHLKLMTLPFAYTKEWERQPTDKITITIPCTVSSELRDYRSVLSAFEKIENDLIEKIRLVLLGIPKGDGNQIIKSFKSLEDSNIEVISFNIFISTLEYEKRLMASDFLILPLKKYGRHHIYQERIGKSKISGGINDMIHFGIPTLIPAHYPLDETLKEISASYLENEMADKVKQWLNDRTYLKSRKKPKVLLEKYGKQKIRQDLLKKINSLLDTI